MECKYCDFKENDTGALFKGKWKEITHNLRKFMNKEGKAEFYLVTNQGRYYNIALLKVNYCPFCGRKLQ